MYSFLIRGGTRLKGKIEISGSKNSALPILAATLMAEGKTTLRSVPRLSDIDSMLKLIGDAQGAAPRVVVIGGGFAGASCARALRQADPRIAVTLVEANATFTACPFSNEVIAGLRELSAQQFTYERVAADGIAVARAMATSSWRCRSGRTVIDMERCSNLTLGSGRTRSPGRR
jgi:NADPH-dependent 2,4-dienoyl-CoA reductase/sulfur reductase-like enzyme